MTTDTTQVAIVGGGPVGLGLAITLALRGIRCVLVERTTRPAPIPKGQNLTQRTMEHFHFWGAEAALRAARTIPPEYGIGGMTAYDTLLGPYHYDWLQRELVRPFYFTDNERLPQYATEAVLRARLAELPGVETLYGWMAERVTEDLEGVTLTLAEREGPGRRTLRAAYAVGCDGARSSVREGAGITQARIDHDKLMVLLVFRSKGLHELLQRYPGKSYYNVLHPELQGYWMFFGRVDLGSTWFFHAPVPAGTTKDSMDFAAYLHRAAGAEFDVAFDHIGFWDLRIAVAENYRKGRILIAGDAAHSHPPYGGYGVNTGFEDAANLGWKLAAELQGWAGPGLLDSYSAERQPVFASTAQDFIGKAIETDRAFLAAFHPDRDRAAFEAEWDARRRGARSEVGAFEPHYEGSPVVFGPPGAASSAVGAHRFEARAGHHLAPLPIRPGRNAFEALGPGFTLLTFEPEGGAAAAFAAAARALRVPLAIVPCTEPETRARYGATHVLVRPDQYVAWAADRPEPAAEAVLRRATGHGA
jgi:2-polyprenyl-6-methoxyphenol hydroxylase-like FAD-dependent oxidoreductase